MNYYSRHIGDYAKDTGHLTLLEHGVYAKLLDVYYAREGPIPEDEAANLIGARTHSERSALANVTRQFFKSCGGRLSQSRCNKEIKLFTKKAETSRKNGASGGRPPKKYKPDGFREITQQVSPNTNNQTPITNNQTPTPTTPQSPPEGEGGGGVDDAGWEEMRDWLERVPKINVGLKTRGIFGVKTLEALKEIWVRTVNAKGVRNRQAFFVDAVKGNG